MSKLNLDKVKSFDIDKFDGEKVKVASVELLDVEKKDFGDGLKEVRQVLIMTEPLEGEGENAVTAREYVPLKKNQETGKFGMPENANSMAMKMLNFFKIEDLGDLVGTEIMVVKKMKKERAVLGIHFGA